MQIIIKSSSHENLVCHKEQTGEGECRAMNGLSIRLDKPSLLPSSPFAFQQIPIHVHHCYDLLIIANLPPISSPSSLEPTSISNHSIALIHSNGFYNTTAIIEYTATHRTGRKVERTIEKTSMMRL